MSKINPGSEEARALAEALDTARERGRVQGRLEATLGIGIPAATLDGLRDGTLVAVPVERIPGVDGQVLVAARALSPEQRKQPEWLWFENSTGQVSLGRWQRVPHAAPYVRLDLVLAAADALARALDQARAEEREACARVCDDWAAAVLAKAPSSPAAVQAAMHADHIRARGKETKE